jgi:alkaline phosphatase
MRVSVLMCAVALLAACSADSPSLPVRPSAPITVAALAPAHGETPAEWYARGAARAAANGAMQGRARNVIVFIGDGMSLTTVSAARILDGQRRGQAGEENRLAWEDFPATALSKTYNTDQQTPDSAGTMSAIVSGVKTRAGVLSVSASSNRGDCAGSLQHPVLTWLELADSAGLSTGVVTTTRLTHATPAATYAHLPERNWENDSALPADAVAAGCHDIARQLLTPRFGTGPTVVLGGGRGQFMHSAQHDPGDPQRLGLRQDGRDLIGEWQRAHPRGRYVWNATQLAAASTAPTLLGLFAFDHLHFEHDRVSDGRGDDQPSLADMTRAAIAVLSRNAAGYVLMVEGGRIDHASHAGNAFRALTDTIALSQAVAAAVATTNSDDTLILVTADHSHTLSFAGYPARGNPILGTVRNNTGVAGEAGDLARDSNGLPYTTLNYGNGPGARTPLTTYDPHPAGAAATASRPDLSAVDTQAADYLQEALLPLAAETHGGDDVGVWARGPGSEAVRGVIEQNVIYHLLVQATPALRQRLCAAGTCNGDGVPVQLPTPGDFMVRAAAQP